MVFWRPNHLNTKLLKVRNLNASVFWIFAIQIPIVFLTTMYVTHLLYKKDFSWSVNGQYNPDTWNDILKTTACKKIFELKSQPVQTNLNKNQSHLKNLEIKSQFEKKCWIEITVWEKLYVKPQCETYTKIILT